MSGWFLHIKEPGVKWLIHFFLLSGRSWAAATTEGLLIFSLEGSISFQPEDLSVDIRPDRIKELIKEKNHSLALSYAFRLNEDDYIKRVIESIPITDGMYASLKSVPYWKKFSRDFNLILIILHF